VSSRDRESLIARIRNIRRATESSPARARSLPDDAGLRPLEDRIAHLEQLVEGLQDSVHRDSKRYGDRIAELEARIQPAAMAKSLTEDARDRGL
jgi:hypothetical protein